MMTPELRREIEHWIRQLSLHSDDVLNIDMEKMSKEEKEFIGCILRGLERLELDMRNVLFQDDLEQVRNICTRVGTQPCKSAHA